jgi:hypothetical protein
MPSAKATLLLRSLASAGLLDAHPSWCMGKQQEPLPFQKGAVFLFNMPKSLQILFLVAQLTHG